MIPSILCPKSPAYCRVGTWLKEFKQGTCSQFFAVTKGLSFLLLISPTKSPNSAVADFKAMGSY